MTDEHSLDDEAPPEIPDISSDPDVEVPSDPDIEVPDGPTSDLDVDIDVEVPSEPGEPIEPEVIKGRPPPRRRQRQQTAAESPQARESFKAPDPADLVDPPPDSLRAPKAPTFEPAILAKEQVSEPPPRASQPPPRPSQPPPRPSQPPRPVSQPPRPVSAPPRPVSAPPRPASQPPRISSQPPAVDMPKPAREASAPEIELHQPSPPPPVADKRVSSIPPSEPPDSEPPVVEPSLPPPPITSSAPPAAASPSSVPPPSSEVPTPPLARSSPPADGAATSYPPPQVAAAPPPVTDPGPQSLRPMRIIQVKQEAVAQARAERVASPPPPAPTPASESLEETDISFPSDETDDELVESDIAAEEGERVSQVEIVDEQKDKDKDKDKFPKPPPPPPRRDSGKLAKHDTPPATSDDGRAKQRKAWWEELFGEDFARANARLKHAQITREADFIEESLGVAKGGTVLDLACGGGYHAVELATRGYGVVGYDLSLYQLAVAADVAQETDQKLNLLQGDMREMAFEETFDGIFCWNTSFGYFEEEKNSAVAQRIFKALRPGGMFLLDVANRDFVVANQPSQTWFEGDACVCMDDMSVDFITSRLRVKRSLILDDGRTLECTYSIRLYGLHELGKILHDVGFRVTEASGHPATPGVFFGASSPRIIILAQRP
jgi:SAM-dependent methyltransferase